MFGFMNWFNKLLKLVGLDKGFLSVTAGNTIASITGAIFWLFIATLMSIEDYGELNYFLSIAFIFGSLSLLGLGTTVTTFLSKKNEDVLYQANLLVLFSNCIVFIILLLFINNLFVVILLVGLSFFAMSRAEDLGRRNYNKFSYFVISQRLVNVPLSLLLYFILGIDGIILGYAVSMLLFSYNFFKSFKDCKLQFDSLKKNLSFIMHSYSVDVLGKIVTHADKLLIAPLFGFGMLGLYQIGFQFLLFLAIIPVSIYQFLLPQEAAGIKQKRIVIIGMVLAVVFSISLFFAIPVIISTIFPAFKEAIQVSQLMIFGIIPSTVNSIMRAKFFGREKTKPILIASSIRVFTLLVLMLFLGEIFGLIGLGIAVLISLSLETIVLLILSKFVLIKYDQGKEFG